MESQLLHNDYLALFFSNSYFPLRCGDAHFAAQWQLFNLSMLLFAPVMVSIARIIGSEVTEMFRSQYIHSSFIHHKPQAAL